MKEKLISATEKKFADLCVSSDIRVDARNIRNGRTVSIKLGPAWGFAEVAFEKTRAVASTSVEAITPSPDRKNDGPVTISVELSAAASELSAKEALHRSSGPPVYAEMRNCIEGFVRESRALDTEALCILAGVKVWSVAVEVDVINDDGNIMDVCMLAVMASLMHARRPDVTVTGKEVRIHTLDEREPVPLPIHHVPLSVSFALFGAGKPYEPDTAVLDPVRNEEVASNGSLTFAFNAQGQVCGVYKAGGLPLHPATFSRCSELAASHAASLTGALKEALEEVSAQHPLATVRPMLANAEPVAAVESQVYSEVEKQPMSMWNATPAADEPAPTIVDKRADPVIREDVMETIFEPGKAKKAAPKANKKEHGSGKLRKKQAVKAKEVVVLDSDSDDDDSSGDDLADAVISRPKGRSRKR